MNWVLMVEYNRASASYDVESVEDIKRIVNEDHPAGNLNLMLVQREWNNDWVLGPYDVILTTIYAGYLVCTRIPEKVFQYRNHTEWADARECFISKCHKCMEAAK